MSAPHHGDGKLTPQMEQILQRFTEQVEGRAKRAYSEGRLNKDDEGDLSFAIAADKEKGVVIMDFGKQVTWLGLPPRQAVELAKMLIEKARLVSKEPLVLTF